MIVYGHKAKEIAKETLNVKCSICGDSNTVQLTLFQKYFHVFWIPFIPLRKVGLTQCTHCKQALTIKEFNGELTEKYQSLKLRTKTPKWTFTGLALFAFLVLWGIYSSNVHDKQNAEIILTPQKNDIYQIKKDNNQYTLYKVGKVENNSVYLVTNLFESNQISGLSNTKMTSDDAFGLDTIITSVDTLKSMLAKGIILDIERNGL